MTLEQEYLRALDLFYFGKGHRTYKHKVSTYHRRKARLNRAVKRLVKRNPSYFDILPCVEMTDLPLP